MRSPIRRRFTRDHLWVPARLSAYLDDDLGPRARARLERHVEECPECRGALHSLSRLLLVLSAPTPALTHDDDEPPVAERVLAGIRDALADEDRR